MKKTLLVVAAVFGSIGCSDRADTPKLEIERMAAAEREKCITEFKFKNPPRKGAIDEMSLALSGCDLPNPNALDIAKCAETYAQNRKGELERQEKDAWDACPGPNSFIPLDKYLAR